MLGLPDKDLYLLPGNSLNSSIIDMSIRISITMPIGSTACADRSICYLLQSSTFISALTGRIQKGWTIPETLARPQLGISSKPLTFLSKDCRPYSTPDTLVEPWDYPMESASGRSDHEVFNWLHKHTDYPRTQHCRLPISIGQHDHQPSAYGIRRIVAGSLNNVSRLPRRQDVSNLPDSFFFNSAKPVTNPALTFRALSAVTG